MQSGAYGLIDTAKVCLLPFNGRYFVTATTVQKSAHEMVRRPVASLLGSSRGDHHIASAGIDLGDVTGLLG